VVQIESSKAGAICEGRRLQLAVPSAEGIYSPQRDHHSKVILQASRVTGVNAWTPVVNFQQSLNPHAAVGTSGVWWEGC
jgi:hypothetical protein